MKRNRWQFYTFLLVLLYFSTAMCGGRLSAQAQTSQSLLLKALVSRDWMERARAYEQLRSGPAALRQQKVRDALLNLLDRENHVLESTLRESHEQLGASAKYGEEYGQYVAELGETVDAFADWNDQHQVCIFVREPYDAGSQFAARIASHANVAVSCLGDMYASDLGILRGKAAAVLARMLANSPNDDAETVTQIHQLVLEALHDPKESVRSETVNALGKFGAQDMVPVLKQIEETDPGPEVAGHSVRGQAAKAIAAIERRAAQEPK